MKILCPVDFSPSSLNAIEYAAKIAEVVHGKLTLINAQNIPFGEGLSLFSGSERTSSAILEAATNKLDEICKTVEKTFKISCNHEIMSSILTSPEQIIADKSKKFDLTIIGTNGADTISQVYFGSRSFAVVQKESGPVIIVPEGCNFTNIKNIVFASDYQKDTEISLNQLEKFMKIFKPDILVMHLAETDNASTQEAFKSYRNLVDNKLKSSFTLRFDRIVSENPALAIEKFTDDSKFDLLVLNMEKKGIWYEVFNESIVRKLTSVASFPILVVH